MGIFLNGDSLSCELSFERKESVEVIIVSVTTQGFSGWGVFDIVTETVDYFQDGVRGLLFDGLELAELRSVDDSLIFVIEKSGSLGHVKIRFRITSQEGDITLAGCAVSDMTYVKRFFDALSTERRIPN
jgi:hypothetical protein